MLHKIASSIAVAAVSLALTGCDAIFDNDPGEPKFAAVSVGTDAAHSCALTNNGEAYCWGGLNSAGELGNGSVRPSGGTLTPDTTAERRVTGDLRFRTISVGGGYTCGTTADAAVYCWGLNQAINATGPVYQGTPIPALLAGARWSAVSAGMASPCGIVPEGGATCGARSADGYGFLTIASAPRFDSFSHYQTIVGSGGPYTKPIFRSYQHQCAISDGSVYCWGENGVGQLGNGTQLAAAAPTRIASPLQFTHVGTGSFRSCALAADGSAWCWGAGSFGALGNGGTAASATPVQVAGGLRFKTLSVGLYHSCAVATDGAAYCWGMNSSGQLGSTVTAERYTPTPTLVAGGLRWKQVSAAARHSCGISTDSRLYCWGTNEYGQLGDGTTISSTTPVRVRIES